jgi:menaquinone-dependent protoporphyrinogen IX oxidase
MFGGIFNLATNDCKQERMLMATDLYNYKIYLQKAMEEEKSNNKKYDYFIENSNINNRNLHSISKKYLNNNRLNINQWKSARFKMN